MARQTIKLGQKVVRSGGGVDFIRWSNPASTRIEGILLDDPTAHAIITRAGINSQGAIDLHIDISGVRGTTRVDLSSAWELSPKAVTFSGESPFTGPLHPGSTIDFDMREPYGWTPQNASRARAAYSRLVRRTSEISITLDDFIFQVDLPTILGLNSTFGLPSVLVEPPPVEVIAPPTFDGVAGSFPRPAVVIVPPEPVDILPATFEGAVSPFAGPSVRVFGFIFRPQTFEGGVSPFAPPAVERVLTRRHDTDLGTFDSGEARFIPPGLMKLLPGEADIVVPSFTGVPGAFTAPTVLLAARPVLDGGRVLSEAFYEAARRGEGERVYLVEISSGRYSGDMLQRASLRITNAPSSIAWDGHTWAAVGGEFNVGVVRETMAPTGQGVELMFSTTDSALVPVLLDRELRGDAVRIWLAPVVAGVLIEPALIFDGIQSGEVSVEDDYGPEANGSRARIQALSRLAVFDQRVTVRNIEASHRAYLRRVGQTGISLENPSFDFVEGLQDRALTIRDRFVGAGEGH